jgi:B12-binding domain/radical SAM domain protein of rhizo-twelve system
MKYALVNPPWSYEGSIYFGCREPHLPLEFGYARQLLELAGHEVQLLDGHLLGLTLADMREQLRLFRPDITVITTAPTYLFWRCPPPELRLPRETAQALRDVAGTLVMVGPHGSTTPLPTMLKTGADAVVLGECEEVLPKLAGDWRTIDGIAYGYGDRFVVQGGPQSANMAALPALRWPETFIRTHAHHHHRFDEPMKGFGGELETSRGCPYSCSFCAKENHRDKFRRRPIATVMEELDGLIAQGVGYVYLVDEILLPNRELLEEFARRDVRFGIQTRIDLWKPDMLDLLGDAGCVSIEAGIESISDVGRRLLNKNCKLDSEELKERLIYARRKVPFVQASLIDSLVDDAQAVEQWRQDLVDHGVWANEPVPVFPYPGSPGYTEIWGPPDAQAWERAHEHYLAQFDHFSDIQDDRPLALAELESLQGPP